MTRVIVLMATLAAIITTVLFFLYYHDKSAVFYYRLGFTLLAQTLLILFLGASGEYRKMSGPLKLVYFITVLVMGALMFSTLYLAPGLFHLKPMSAKITTALLIEGGVEIGLCLLLFAAGNLVFRQES